MNEREHGEGMEKETLTAEGNAMERKGEVTMFYQEGRKSRKKMKELQEKQQDKDRLERSRKRPEDRQIERDRENEEEIKDQEARHIQGVRECT